MNTNKKHASQLHSFTSNFNVFPPQESSYFRILPIQGKRKRKNVSVTSSEQVSKSFLKRNSMYDKRKTKNPEEY